jgi:hypothetical protein
MKRIFVRTFIFAGLTIISFASVSAQAPSPGVNVMPPPGFTAQVGGGDMGFKFVSGEIGVSTNVVKGAPFSLEATVESSQTLADGNRIVHKQDVRLYRDSKGRTRREETLGAIGPWSASGVPPTIITIQDPVSGANYSLDSEHKIAAKLPAFPNGKSVMVARGPGGGFGPVSKSLAGGGIAVAGAGTSDSNSAATQVFFARPEGGPAFFALSAGPHDQAAQPEEKSESLGKETIAGLPADGTRTTTTIPAGAIGNERPLEIVREQWYSSDLQIVLRSKRADPRFGGTAYEVTKIDRAEPVSSLFEVPPDYKVVKMPSPQPLPGSSDQK